MCNGHNLNPIVGNSIHDLERKAAEEIAASAVHEQRQRSAIQGWLRSRDRSLRGRSPQRTDFFRDTTAKRLGPLQLRQDGEQGAVPASATEDLSASITPRNNTIRRCIEVLKAASNLLFPLPFSVSINRHIKAIEQRSRHGSSRFRRKLQCLFDQLCCLRTHTLILAESTCSGKPRGLRGRWGEKNKVSGTISQRVAGQRLPTLHSFKPQGNLTSFPK
jgi:hypothetical protein